jgi:hypothetical protein
MEYFLANCYTQYISLEKIEICIADFNKTAKDEERIGRHLRSKKQ